jgi:hypothetical protein
MLNEKAKELKRIAEMCGVTTNSKIQGQLNDKETVSVFVGYLQIHANYNYRVLNLKTKHIKDCFINIVFEKSCKHVADLLTKYTSREIFAEHVSKFRGGDTHTNMLGVGFQGSQGFAFLWRQNCPSGSRVPALLHFWRHPDIGTP